MNDNNEQSQPGTEKPAKPDNDLLRLKAGADHPDEIQTQLDRAGDKAADVFAEGAAEWSGLLYGIGVPTVEGFAPNWKGPLTSEGSKEMDKLKTWAVACGPCLQKYLPDGPANSPEATAIIITALTFLPLLSVPRYAPEKQGAA